MRTPLTDRPWPTVVGLGASAGGLETLLDLLPRLPRTGLAYVLAQHMANPTHGELLLRLLQRGTPMPITLARDGQRLQPGQACLVPAGQDALVEGDRLRLVPPLPGQASTPSVNRLLASLAARGGAQAAALVLSGAGTDGALGAKALHAAGGLVLVLVQDPAEAKFDGMPQATLQALGPAAAPALPLAQMGQALATHFSQAALAPGPWPGPHPAPPRPADAVSIPPLAPPAPELAALLPRVQAITGVDFSGYKEDTLLRGLAKRKAALGLDGAPPTAYADWLARHPDEAWRLQALFLVTVSSFFRDAQAFQALEHALRSRAATLPPGQALRVWVPACATGEEACSIALLLHRLLTCGADPALVRPFTVFASDLNPQALAIARAGRYRAAALAALPADLQGRYVHPQGEWAQLAPEVHDRIQWTEANVFTQSPPEHLDLVSCRNLLIYLRAPAQAQLLARFHASLRPQGLLFIGQSESLALDGQALFAPLDYFHRLFVRKDPPPTLWRRWGMSGAPSLPPAAPP